MRFNNRACALMDIPDLPQGAFEHIGNGKIKPQGGGGGFVGDFVENTLGSAGDFVENTASSAVDYVGDQIQEIVDDPVKFGAKVAAVASGNAWAIPLIDGIDTIEEGGTIEEGLLSAGKSYAGQQIGAEFGGEFATTGEDFNMGDSGDFYSGGDLFTSPPTNLVASNTGVVSDYEIDPTAQALQNAIDRGDFIQDRPLTPEELEAAGIRDGAPIRDESREVTLTPGGNAVPANTLPSEMAAIDAEIAAAAKALPSSISPMQALRGLRSASSLLGGQQQQQMPQQQMMIGGRQPNQYGGVDYSGLLSLLTPRMVSRNSLLG